MSEGPIVDAVRAGCAELGEGLRIAARDSQFYLIEIQRQRELVRQEVLRRICWCGLGLLVSTTVALLVLSWPVALGFAFSVVCSAAICTWPAIAWRNGRWTP